MTTTRTRDRNLKRESFSRSSLLVLVSSSAFGFEDENDCLPEQRPPLDLPLIRFARGREDLSSDGYNRRRSAILTGRFCSTLVRAAMPVRQDIAPARESGSRM